MNRRGIMKGIAALGIGGKPAVEAALPLVVPGEGEGLEAMTVPEYAPWKESSLGKAAWKALYRKREQSARKFREKQKYRIAGLDPDLWERKSGSLSHRARVQFERDEAFEREFQRTRFQLWPDRMDDYC